MFLDFISFCMKCGKILNFDLEFGKFAGGLVLEDFQRFNDIKVLAEKVNEPQSHEFEDYSGRELREPKAKEISKKIGSANDANTDINGELNPMSSLGTGMASANTGYIPYFSFQYKFIEGLRCGFNEGVILALGNHI